MPTYIIGYELNERYSQISFCSAQSPEPETIQTIDYTVPDLYQRALRQEKIEVEGKVYDAVWLLAKFVESTLSRFETVEQLVFTVPEINIDIAKMLKGIGQRIGVSKANIYVQDYKESFFQYMLYQPKELWHYEAALFYCDRKEVRAYMLRKLRTGFGKGTQVFVTVDEVAHAKMKELEAIYPVLNVDRAKDADTRFRQFVEGVFNKKLVSSVFLVGEGFENNWYPLSLKVLCNGRRAFLGNNLYSKGACYTAYRRSQDDSENSIYLDETKMTEQICMKMRVKGKEIWYPLVSWGSRWYEADTSLEILLKDNEDLEIHIESLTGTAMQVVSVPMRDLPKRQDYTLRLQVKVLFQDERTCRISFKDVGFGEFFPATDFYKEVEIHLGGSNGQFHSLS